MRALKELVDLSQLTPFYKILSPHTFPQFCIMLCNILENILGDLSIAVIAPSSQSSYVYLTNVSCNVR